MYKNGISLMPVMYLGLVSILVLMELCIKTQCLYQAVKSYPCFNPCFNGTMYKNRLFGICNGWVLPVSILVLMELCIKTFTAERIEKVRDSFNPCFNGTMYKNFEPKM